MNSVVALNQSLQQRLAHAFGNPQTVTCRVQVVTVATLVMTAVALFLCQVWGIRPAWNLNLYVLVQCLVALFTIPVVGTAFLMVTICRRRSGHLKMRRIAWLDFAKHMALFIPMAWIYTHIKAGVLLRESWDATLSRWDRWLCAGHDPVVLTRTVVPDYLYPFFHQVYVALIPLMMGTVFWLVLAGRRVRARRLAAALYLGYFIGVLAYHLMPSYGPAYVIPGNETAHICHATHHLQQVLLERVRAVQSDPGSTTLWPWVYIAAFPSLHVSHVLIVMWYFRYSRTGFWITGVFAFLSTVSTVLFGWHYVVDWFGGIVVAVVAIWMASWRPVPIRLPYWPDRDEGLKNQPSV